MRATNIIWDVDNKEDLEFLPTEIELPVGMIDEDEISDYISDETGFCHMGFELEFTIQEKEQIKITMNKFNEFLLENGFVFTDKNNDEHYFYEKVIDNIKYVFCLTAPHEETEFEYLLRAERDDEFEGRWSVASFMKSYENVEDFKTNLNNFFNE